MLFRSPTGAAANGEVEDHTVTIVKRSDGTVQSNVKISDGLAGFLPSGLETNDFFGSAVANLGDVNGDGVSDLAVGARGDENGESSEGAVYVLMMNTNGTVASQVKITPTAVDLGDCFGAAVAGLGDIDGDGVPDMAVGAWGKFNFQGAAYVLLLNSNGTVKSEVQIRDGESGFIPGGLEDSDRFGSSIAGIGDLDGDGVPDLAVGAERDEFTGSDGQGAIYVLFMNSDATVRSNVKITNFMSGFSPAELSPNDRFGSSLANLGDLDGDGVADLAVGAKFDEPFDAHSGYVGAVYVLLMNRSGTVKSHVKISDFLANFHSGFTLTADDKLGTAVAGAGDLDGDGVPDMIVGAYGDENTEAGEGALYVMFLNSNGTVRDHLKISDGLGGFTPSGLIGDDNLGSAVASLGDLNGDGVPDLAVGAYKDENLETSEGAIYILNLNLAPPTFDFGDAPDTGAGTGLRNYNTLSTDGGPQHTIVPGLMLGARVDFEAQARANVRASGDDTHAWPDDEDGLNNPAADLRLTIGAQPKIHVLATNNTNEGATLYGWIDYNANGVFENATERASATVVQNTENLVYTLAFPAVPAGFTGETFARLRLSSDAAAADPTGAAVGGEVEDHLVTILKRTGGTVKSNDKIADLSGGTSLEENDHFGSAVALMGDINGDGVPELAVGAEYDESSEFNEGALHVLYMNSDGSVLNSVAISEGLRGFDPLYLDTRDRFGSAVAALGDLDGNGVVDLAVGARDDESHDFDAGNFNEGAVYVLFMNDDGSVKSNVKISDALAGFNPVGLEDFDNFGSAVASLGDLDGDGVVDLAVGAMKDEIADTSEGAVYVLMMNRDGTVKSHVKIGEGLAGFTASLGTHDLFGNAVAGLGDLNGDGVPELAVGTFSGEAVYVLFMNRNGTVQSHIKIGEGQSGFNPASTNVFGFGKAVAAPGDLDADGVADLIVSAYHDADSAELYEGQLFVLFLNSTGTVKGHVKISRNTAGFSPEELEGGDRFGTAMAAVGDLDGDGVPDLAVGAAYDEFFEESEGALYILNLLPPNNPPVAIDDEADDTDQNQPLQIDPAELLANDTDADGHALTLTAVGSASGGTVEIVEGAIVFSPALDYLGPASFEYTVSDGQASDVGLVTLNVIAINDPPVAENDIASNTNEDTNLPIPAVDLLVNDDDVDGDTLSVTAVDSPVGGEVALESGVITFTPDPDYHGPASFEYTVSDGVATDTGTVTFNVLSVPDAPVAVDDAVPDTVEDTAFNISVGDLLSNDTDADGDVLSVASVQNAIGGSVSLSAGVITFTPTQNYVGPASFEYTVSDSAASDTGAVLFSVTGVNDPPTISSFGSDITYLENAPAIAIAPASTSIADLDSGNFDTGTLTVKFTSGGTTFDRLAIRTAGNLSTNAQNQVIYSGNVVGTFAGGVGATPLVVTLNGLVTPGLAGIILRNVVYSNVSDNPTAARTVWARVTDGDGGASAAVTKTISVTPVNDRPTITGFGAAVTHTEDGAAVAIAAAAATVNDPDSANFDGGTLTAKFTAGARAEDRLTIRNNAVLTTTASEVLYNAVLIGTFSGGTGTTQLVVTFNAAADPGKAGVVLRNIVYRAASQNPSTAPRTAWMQITDGDGGASPIVTKTLSVIAVNDPPVLSGISGSTGYTLNSGTAVLLAGAATVTDVDSPNFDTGKLTVEITSGTDAGNRLDFGGLFSVDGSGNVLRSGVAIGTLNTGGGVGTTKLEVTFNAQALPSYVQQLVRAIRFRTVGSSSLAQRVVSFTLTDGDGGTSATLTKTVNVT